MSAELESAELARAYGPLVRHLARRGGPPHVLEDLIGYGMVGLIEAARRFDPARARFSTFAFHRIRGAIRDGVRRLDAGRRPRCGPDGPEERRDPDVDVDAVPAEGPATDDAAARRLLGARLADALADLDPRERWLLEAHYVGDLPLAAAGAHLGLSRSWTSRLHARAIDKLGRLLEDRRREPSDASPRGDDA